MPANASRPARACPATASLLRGIDRPVDANAAQRLAQTARRHSLDGFVQGLSAAGSIGRRLLCWSAPVSERPRGSCRGSPEGPGGAGEGQQHRDKGRAVCAGNRHNAAHTAAGTCVPPVSACKMPPVTQPATAAALTCEGQVHSPSGLHRAWVRTSPCLFHLVSLDAVVLLPSHWQGPHGPCGPSWPILVRSGPYGPDGTFALQQPARLAQLPGLAWSTDFGCISGDAEWKTAHPLAPLASQLLHLFLFLTHDDPLVFLALPEQASLSLLILWTSGQFDSRVACCALAVSRVAKRYHWWHVQSSTYTRARTHLICC